MIDNKKKKILKEKNYLNGGGINDFVTLNNLLFKEVTKCTSI